MSSRVQKAVSSETLLHGKHTALFTDKTHHHAAAFPRLLRDGCAVLLCAPGRSGHLGLVLLPSSWKRRHRA